MLVNIMRSTEPGTAMSNRSRAKASAKRRRGEPTGALRRSMAARSARRKCAAIRGGGSSDCDDEGETNRQGHANEFGMGLPDGRLRAKIDPARPDIVEGRER